MTLASRKYPRIPLQKPAQLDVLHRVKGKREWDSIDVIVKSASCEGVGLQIASPPIHPIRRRIKSVLHFVAGDRPVVIPGRIAWSKNASEHGLELGIQFDLALAKATSRELYSSWIVANIIGLREFAEQLD